LGFHGINDSGFVIVRKKRSVQLHTDPVSRILKVRNKFKITVQPAVCDKKKY